MSQPSSPNPIVLPKAYRIMESASVALCVGLLVVLGVRVGRGCVALAHGDSALPSLGWAAFSIALGYLAADLASGVVHFLADTFGSIDTPVLGKKFILPFRAHHERPHEITEHDFVETNGDSCFVALLALVPVLLVVRVERGGLATYAGLFTLTLLALVVVTNQFHKWAHARSVAPTVRTLQRLGLVLRPEEHARHHTAPFVGRYCITTGLLNPFLDAVRFFPFLERLIRTLLRPFGPRGRPGSPG